METPGVVKEGVIGRAGKRKRSTGQAAKPKPARIRANSQKQAKGRK